MPPHGGAQLHVKAQGDKTYYKVGGTEAQVCGELAKRIRCRLGHPNTGTPGNPGIRRDLETNWHSDFMPKRAGPAFAETAIVLASVRQVLGVLADDKAEVMAQLADGTEQPKLMARLVYPAIALRHNQAIQKSLSMKPVLENRGSRSRHRSGSRAL